ncbi:MAG TPA: YihY/virulence factor BrkB family protein [Acetobacteraceae bacterium]|nr:YihY/virulence factor BrkB family protein [Acetobacteraceae bacterium]
MPDDQASSAAEPRADDTGSSAPTRRWLDVLRRAWNEAGTDNVSLIAGGVTYSMLLALFPGLAALVSIYGLVADPAQVEQQVNAMSGLLPGSGQQLISTELHQLVSASGGALSFGVVFGLVLALWTASSGMSGMISALNIAYDQPERRGFVRFYLLALALTVGVIISGVVMIALVAVLPAALGAIGGTGFLQWAALLVEWPLLIVFVLTALAVLYRFAPDRDDARWQWLSPGGVAATLLWIIGSILFAVYVSHFGSYNKTYGSLGAVIVLLVWLWLSNYVVLFGAEINAEAERKGPRERTLAKSSAS